MEDAPLPSTTIHKATTNSVPNNVPVPPNQSSFIKFGSLIEQHVGNFDLKAEMEKLKQLDHEQKMKRRISLKVGPHHNNNNSPLRETFGEQ